MQAIALVKKSPKVCKERLSIPAKFQEEINSCHDNTEHCNMWHQRTSASMLRKLLITLSLLLSQNVRAYTPISKDILADMLLTDLLTNMDQSNNYFDMDVELPTKNVDLVSRSSKNNGPSSGVDEYEYRNMFGGGSSGGSSNPAIRDQEYLHHSAALWGHQYISGGMGEAPYSTIIKTDQSLPAYCNPPNPCPHNYDEAQGCIEGGFDNTAIFSREYQARQECQCDHEHMFDCAAQDNNANNNDMEKFLMHQFQNENAIESNAVVKKTYPLHGHKAHNPYLQGDRLPIAAKKGLHIRV